MSKPIYKSRKFWTAVFAGVGAGLASYFDNDQLAYVVGGVGATLVGSLGLEDFGKAKALSEASK